MPNIVYLPLFPVFLLTNDGTLVQMTRLLRRQWTNDQYEKAYKAKQPSF